MNNPKTRDDGMEKEAHRLVEGGEADQQSQWPGDNRTPDKTMGQVKYADNQGRGELKTEGSTGDPQTSPMVAEKAEENAVPKANRDKSPVEGRPHPRPNRDYRTETTGLQDAHDPNDLEQKLANNPKAEKSQREGPAAYAPHANEPTKPKEGR